MVSGKSGCCGVFTNIISNGVTPVEACTAVRYANRTSGRYRSHSALS